MSKLITQNDLKSVLEDIEFQIVHDVFFGDYGETSYTTISAALADGKDVIIRENGGFYHYVYTDTVSPYTHLFVRLRGNSTIPTQYVLHLAPDNTWSKDTTTLGTFPVNSTYTTSTNTNPSTYLGGTWTLIDKQFKSQWITSGFTWNSTNTTGGAFTCIPSGHSLEFRFSWQNKVAASDDTITLGTWAGSSLLSTAAHVCYCIAEADGINGVGLLAFNLTTLPSTAATLTMADVVTRAASYPTTTGQTFQGTLTISVRYGCMADAACDRFVWKRTA